MFRVMRRKGLALALSVALITPAVALAAENPAVNPGASDYDVRMRDLDTQMRNVLSSPTDFCDVAAMDAQERAYDHLLFQKFQLQREHEKVHPTLMQSARKAEQSAADEGYLVEEMPNVDNYEAALKRGDRAADALLKKMTPWEQVRAALRQHDYALVLNTLTPMADQGDAKAQSYLAVLYNQQTTFYALYGKDNPPRDDALAFKYAHMAALNGDEIAQEVLAKTYACGMGTQKDLAKAYAWFSLAVAQSALSLATNAKPQDILNRRAFIAASMGRDDMQRAKHMIIACHTSGYKECD